MTYDTHTNVAPENLPSLVMDGDGGVEVQSVLGRGGFSDSLMDRFATSISSAHFC
jgi:hypothetical protein